MDRQLLPLQEQGLGSHYSSLWCGWNFTAVHIKNQGKHVASHFLLTGQQCLEPASSSSTLPLPWEQRPERLSELAPAYEGYPGSPVGEKRREVTLISGLKCLELISPEEEKQVCLLDCTLRPAFRSTVLPNGSHRDLQRTAFPEFRREAALPTTCQQPENHCKCCGLMTLGIRAQV